MSKSKLVDAIGQFTTIPNTVMKMWREIGLDAFGLFAYLRYRSDKHDECFPAYDLICEETTMTRKRLSAAIKTLEGVGLLERKKRFGNSTIYILKLPTPPTSSVPVELLDETPVVHLLDSSSVPVELSVVQQVHANQTQLTRSILTRVEEEPRVHTAADFPKPITVRNVFMAATGMVAIPGNDPTYKDKIQDMLDVNGEEATTESMKRNYQKWINTTGKNGRTYSRTRLEWIDWAVADLAKPPESAPTSSLDSINEWLNKQ